MGVGVLFSIGVILATLPLLGRITRAENARFEEHGLDLTAGQSSTNSASTPSANPVSGDGPGDGHADEGLHRARRRTGLGG